MNRYKILLILTKANIEVWRDINGFEGLYQVSNLGRIRSLDREIVYKNGKVHRYKGQTMKPNMTGRGYKEDEGYYGITLRNSGVRTPVSVHRVVAETFIPNPYNKETVNHIDENKTNNRMDNLEWLTDYENNRYGTHDVRQAQSLINNPKISKPVISINVITGEVKEYPSRKEAQRQIGSYPNINMIVSHGCRWYYKEDYIKNGDWKK